MSQRFDKLVTLLRELFQLDQPDLDFGFYRIMHAKSAEVTQFLEQDLLPQVKSAFAEYKPADKAAIEKELAQAVEQAQGLGVDPDSTQKVKELRARLADEAVDLDALEAEVYDHLYRFFRRYYTEGDFLSKRVYKEGVYAIPYEGEEVKLHWANHDQYYIKTSEYLRDYAFRLRPGDARNPMRVHFRLVDAAEGEHGNVKESNRRVFVLAAEDFIAEKDGPEGKELVIHFEYRPATLTDWPEEEREGRKKPPAQKDLLAAAEARLLAATDAALAPWINALDKPHIKSDGEAADYLRLRAHLNRYTARNTFDYFIHKDLGGFLRRELDFFIKNEVMHLDDIESETVPRVEQYLSKIKVIRRIAGKIIEFLAQLENFQKKLWLKKKFVTETSWCVRVGIIPAEFLAEIAASDAQREEWVKLHAVDGIEGDLVAPGYSVPLSPEFLKAQPTLMVDTRHFDADFTARLLEVVGDLDEQTDGVLFHSENFQALSLMQARCREGVKCVYIDPPYNTGSDGFVYKDAYQHACWMSLMADRLRLARNLMTPSAGGACNLNDIEDWRMRGMINAEFGESAYVTTVVTKCSTPSSFRTVNIGPVDVTDRIVLFAKDRDEFSFSPQPVEKPVDLQHFGRFIENIGNPPQEWVFKPIRLQVLQDLGFACGSTQTGMRIARERWGDGAKFVVDRACETFALQNADRVFELKTLQKPSPWLREHIAVSRANKDRIVVVQREAGDPILLLGGRQFYFLSKGVVEIEGKRRLTEPASTLWSDIDTNNLRHEGDVEFPAGKKPMKLVERILRMSEHASGSLCLDHFAGSGTTGHAVINLNREDGGQRKFILVEMGDYFDTVLLPRLKKATYTPEWKDGKPKRRATPEEAEHGPRIMKVVRLESYEDTLNNLDLRRTEIQEKTLFSPEAQGPDGFREQYLLRYLLDVETRGSASLLDTAAFTDPTAYRLKVKRPGSDEAREVCVDLIETFHWLIGLTVRHIAAPRAFTASFKCDPDPDLPKGAPRRLLLDGRLQEDLEGRWWFRAIEGELRDGRKTLVLWRNRPGGEEPDGVEQDNLVLDTWFQKQGYSSKDSEFDLIYVNGTNNLENLKAPDDTWKVRLIEDDFHRLMFEADESGRRGAL